MAVIDALTRKVEADDGFDELERGNLDFHVRQDRRRHSELDRRVLMVLRLLGGLVVFEVVAHMPNLAVVAGFLLKVLS